MTSQQGDYFPGLLPWPASLVREDGYLAIESTHIEARYARRRSKRLERAVARCAEDLAELTGLPLTGGRGIRLVISVQSLSSAYPGLTDDESYILCVDPRGVTLDAAGEWGVLRGLATLTQLTSAQGHVPCVVIGDQPWFAWRGLLLDVARHFLDVQTIKRTLDGMAQCKLNVLHLHLSDDQGFRFPSTEYPKLRGDPCFGREELEALVEYAADRGIRVVPEIDMPGHVTSWLAAYPEWGSRPVAESQRFGVHEGCLDPSREDVYTAVKKLLGEVAAVFPDPCIHIGGDEVHPTWWSEDAGIESFMEAQGLSEIRDLQAHFNKRVAGYVKDLGRQVVAWDEVLHPALPQDWIVQAWRGATARDRGLARGNRVLVSAPYYLDLNFPACVHHGSGPVASQKTLLALEDELLEDPRFAHVAQGMRWTHHWRRDAVELDPAVKKTEQVLGGEACLWGELVDQEVLDVRLWSRLPAVAERLWSSSADGFELPEFYPRLENFLETILPLRGFDLEARVHAQLAAIGMDERWHVLTRMLEPVKWYGRLLGQQALEARLRGEEMPESRPYNTTTPLNNLADFLPPESLFARHLDGLCVAAAADDKNAAAELSDVAALWGRLPDPATVPAALADFPAVLVTLGGLIVGRLAGRTVAVEQVDVLAQPRAELMLAIGPELRAWLAGEL